MDFIYVVIAFTYSYIHNLIQLQLPSVVSVRIVRPFTNSV